MGGIKPSLVPLLLRRYTTHTLEAARLWPQPPPTGKYPMTTLSAEYRNRLYATQQSRRSRKAEERRKSGPVDVDDFYVPTSPSSQTRRRSKTPQPDIHNSSLRHTQGNHVEERRSQSAPRSISEQQSSPPSNSRDLANNGETVFCFQPGRRRFKAPLRPANAVHHSDTKAKKSLSQFQLYNEMQKHDDLDEQRVFQNNTNNLGLHPSASTNSEAKNTELYNIAKNDVRIHGKPRIVDTVPVSNRTATDDPRVYAANYYAKKVGVNNKSSGRSYVKSRDTQESVTRSMSRKMADCLLLSKSLFDDEPADKTRRKLKTTNPLTSLCFVDNEANVSHETFDITTIDLNSYDARSPNVSALHENSPFHDKTTPIPNDKNMHQFRRTSKKKWQEDHSTNQTTAVSTSSSDNEEEYDDTITHDTITSDSILRPPKVLNLMKGTIREAKQQHSQPPIIQVNPDDYDYSYRKKRTVPLSATPGDIDFLSEVAVNSTLPEAPEGFIGPLPQQRDLQRRPRGIFELVTSNDDGDNNDNDDNINDNEWTAALNTPYDESEGKNDQSFRGKGRMSDMANDTKQITVKYNEAILELQQQRKLVTTFENELKQTLMELEAVKNDLQKTKDDASERSRTYADATAKIVQERLESDEKLKEEQDANKKLKDEVECLKREVISLSLELERAVHRNTWSSFHQNLPASSTQVMNNALADDLSTTSNKSDSQSNKVTAEVRLMESSYNSNTQIEEATKALEFMSEKLQASQKEVSDLQSQLTAMRAANELYNKSYEQLQRERDEAITQKFVILREMEQTKSKIEEFDIQTDLFEREIKETARLKEEIVSLNNELSYANIRASDYATNVQRLEDELVRSQLHAAKCEIQVSALETVLRESERATRVTTHQRQNEVMLQPLDIDVTKKSQLESIQESIHSSMELSMERQLVEAEMDQLFTSRIEQSDTVPHLYAGDNNTTNRDAIGRVSRGRGSSDLLDILRKKLEPT